MALCLGHLNFGKIFGRLPGVHFTFRSTLPISPEHGWSWDTKTIKTHMPTYKQSLAYNTLPLFIAVLIPWHWISLLDFVQVQLKLRTQGFLSSEFLLSLVNKLA